MRNFTRLAVVATLSLTLDDCTVPISDPRYSFVLLGTARAFGETFGSCCHGAGRRLSRRAATRATVDEEIPEAYKDVADVVAVVAGAGIGRKVVKLCPLGVVKG
jgi:tRNA-splicing ligase RtcB